MTTDTTPRAERRRAAGAVQRGGGPPRRRRLFWFGRFSRRARVIAVVVVVVVIGGAAGAWAATRSSSTGASYRLVAASLSTIRQTVAASGTLEPAHEADLSFGVSGEVTAVNATVGQTVKAGQTLATIDAASLATQVAEAQATVATDQARVSSDESDSATSTQLAADQAALTSAQDALTSAQKNLSEGSLTTPIAGVIASVNLTVGQQVAAGSSASGSGSASSASSGSGSGGGGSGGGSGSGSGSGGGGGGGGSSSSTSSSSSSSSSSAQIVVVGTDSYLVNATVDDTEISQIKTGDQAVITPTGSTATVYGLVGSVGVIATSTSGVASYPVTVNVTGSPSGLHPGASADASIIVKQLSDVLTVPSTAIHTSGANTTVYELAGGRQVAHTVTTGTTSGGETQITGGLTAGTQVVVPVTRAASGSTARTGRTGTGTGTGTGRGFGGGGGGFGGGTGGGFGRAGG